MNHVKTLLRLWRESHNATPLSETEVKEVAQTLKALQRGLTGKRNLAGAGYMDETLTLGAYLLYYFPVSYKQVSLALESALSHLSFAQQTQLEILDVGSGPGPASAATLDALISRGFPADKINVTLLDSSANALDLAEELFREDFPAVHVTSRVVNLEHLANDLLRKNYDIILASHAVNELWTAKSDAFERKTRFLLRLGETLTHNGLMLLCEPALLETSRTLIALVSELAQHGFHILAPCPSVDKKDWECPALRAERATCHAQVFSHFGHPIDEIAREAHLVREGVKMTFFALSKSSPIEGKSPALRVVSDAMLNKSGRIRYLLCDGKRRIAISAKQTDAHAAAEGFFNLGHYDRVEVFHPEIRGTEAEPAWGFSETTQLKVERFSKENASDSVKLLQAHSAQRKVDRKDKTRRNPHRNT